ncbi:MAG: RidA family protein [Gemmatimonadota bacterium]
MTFHRSFSGAPWEEEVGYCRALRTGKNVYVTGTAPVDPDGSVHASGDGYRQTVRCIEIIREALEELGGNLGRVVRTRMFVTDIARWEEFAQGHREAFSAHPPATTLVEVRSLIHPDMLIEIEAEAILE